LILSAITPVLPREFLQTPYSAIFAHKWLTSITYALQYQVDDHQ